MDGVGIAGGGEQDKGREGEMGLVCKIFKNPYFFKILLFFKYRYVYIYTYRDTFSSL